MRGAGKYYDPAADYQSKVADLRVEWMEKMASEEDLMTTIGDDEYPSEVHEYFVRTQGKAGKGEGEGSGKGDMEVGEKKSL